MTREEHLQRCKDVAMKCVERGDLLEAVTSMMSDLDKHPETKASTGGAMAMLGFARRFRPERRTTADWMAELRAGERE